MYDLTALLQNIEDCNSNIAVFEKEIRKQQAHKAELQRLVAETQEKLMERSSDGKNRH